MHWLLVWASLTVAGRGPAALLGIFASLCLGDCAHEVSILTAMIGDDGRCRGVNRGKGCGLRRLGFIEGQNLTIDWRSYGQRIDLISEFAAELVKAHVDVIYAAGVTAIRAVQRAHGDDLHSRGCRRMVGVGQL